ncbi:hypothetical protein CJI50_04635 [Bifidobacteriaceae bacterium NR021]|nr:hypothetical protein CJI50_04635 [Bifidobacteriaceae bacterium NR021]
MCLLRYAADAANASMVLFCENVGIDEYILHAMLLFFKNVGIDEYFLCAMPSFCENVGIE